MLGDNVTVKNNVCIWDGVEIADDVFIGPNVAFTNDRYPRSPRMQFVRSRYEHIENWLQTTTVHRGATIGANATICPNVELGEFCFVAAGAVVTKDVPPFAIVAGSPARLVGFACRCGQRALLDVPGATCEACQRSPATESI